MSCLVVGYGFLPSGAEHPMPSEIGTAIVALYTYVYSMNMIWPVDTAITVFLLALLVEIYADLVWPFILSVIGWLGRIA